MSDIYNEKIDSYQAGTYVNRLSAEIDKLSAKDQQIFSDMALESQNDIMRKMNINHYDTRAMTMLVVFIMFSSVLAALKQYGFWSFFEEDE